MSARPFRFGFQETASSDPDGIRAAATTAEKVGCDEYWSSDHIGAADPYLPLQFAADATTTLRVGPLTLNNEFHHPAMIARTIATLDRLSSGRAILGLGTGFAQHEHDATAIPLRPPGERVSRFGETLEVVRALLDTGSCTFAGEHHQIAIDDLGVRPVQSRVPFLVGGNGPRVIGLGARHADIFQFTGLTFPPEGRPDTAGMRLDEVRKKRDRFEAAAGDRLDDVELSALVQRAVVGDDTAAAVDEITERTGLAGDDLAECPFFLIGSVAELVDKLGRLRDELGISHYVIRDAEAMAPVIAQLT